MDEKLKICPECETANESEYIYCKNCGTRLPEEQIKHESVYGQEPTSGEITCPNCHTENLKGFNFCKNCGAPLSPAARYGFPEAVTEIDGVPTEDLKLFVGKNSDSIVGKWSKMAQTKNRFSWCWPIALLSLLFGFAGAAFWFLYRRMYKIGILLLAISLVFTGIQVASFADAIDNLSGELLVNEEFISIVEEFKTTGDYAKYSADLTAMLQSNPDIMDELTRVSNISNIFGLINIVAVIWLSMYALNIYKNFTISKLRIFTHKPTPVELSLSGGTSAGALAAGIMIYVMLTGSFSILLTLGIMLF